MRPTTNAWQAGEPLTDLTFFADWDPVTSMILSLRIHLFEYGTIPSWNFMLCHGRPELSVPYSWAWTWPSLLGYALAPVHAVLAVWLVMSLLGLAATWALLRRWTGSRAGAGLGAAVYVLCGYFAAHFNAGHLTFAFHHWVPLLMWLFEVGFERMRAGRRVLGLLLGTTLAAYLFVSAGLPHPLLHFYPVLLLLVVYRVLRASREIGLRAALAAAWMPAVASGLGVGLALHKLWPVIWWQRAHPREGVRFESYGVLDVLRNTLGWVTDYASVPVAQPWHVYPSWGYNAFVGPVPWLCAGLVLAAAVWLRLSSERGAAHGGGTPARWPDPHGAVVFGAGLVVIGIALSLGNGNPASPAYLFRHLPILDGIRAFYRFQIWIVLGLAILLAQAVAGLERLTQGRSALRRALLAALGVAALAPLIVQAVALVRNIPAARNAEILASRGVGAPDVPPRLVATRKGPPLAVGPQTAILDHGSWLGRCHHNITLPRDFPDRLPRIAPLTDPPPVAIDALGHDRITLRYAPGERRPIRLHLRTSAWGQLDVPHHVEEGWVVVDGGGLVDDRFTLRMRAPGVVQGLWASGAFLGLAAAFFAVVARRDRRAA